jgi:hypothetical protein
MRDGQILIGQGAGASITAISGITLAPFSATLPATGGTRPSLTTSAGTTNAITLGSGNTVRGLNVGDKTGAGIAGTNFGTLTLNEVDITGTGQALNLNTGTANATFGTVSSSSGTNGIALTSVAGTLDFGSGGTLTGSTGDELLVSGGSNTWTYPGAITNTGTGKAVNITGRTGGTITLSGQITDSGGTGQGISLTSNTGATVNLTGGVTLSTGANPAFTASGGGTVNVTGSGNTLTNTTATALVVQNTTIGASGITFQSINSSGGTADGIILDNTGATGGLTVTGDGTNTSVGGNGSGGTISNKSGSDGSTTTGIGIYLNNTSNVVLRRMTINGTNQNFGIRGTGVSGMTLEYSTVAGSNGNNNGADEGSVIFDGLTGTSSFASDAISGAVEDHFRVRNSSGTANNIVITGSTFTGTASSNDNVILEPSGTATVTAHITNNTFTSAGGDHLQTATRESATLNIVFTGNTMTNPASGSGSLLGGVTISGGNLNPTSTEHVNFNISNNTVTGTVQGGALNINEGNGNGVWQGQVSNNNIGNAAVAGSGCAQCSGIRVENHSPSGSLTAIVSGNTIRQWSNGPAINTQAGDAGNASNTGVLNVTVTNNTAANPGALSQHGFVANIGAGSGSGTAANVACVDPRTNTLDGNVVNGGAGVRTRQREVSTVRIPGYTGTQYDITAVATYLQTLNPASVGPATAATSSAGPGYTNTSPAGSPCPQPTVPS